ncbi:MAG TPA: hypothetical protein VM925_26880, partial [Labilithrix sp.]|nr:hypothetical protein [Labilithrix sp.]
MSSTSRSPDEKVASPEEPEKKKAGSPGRYSLADDGGSVPSTRIDSTSRMPAVRLEAAGPRSTSSGAMPAQSAPASTKEPPVSASPASTAAATKETNKKPPVPSGVGPPKSNATQRAMPAPQAKGAAPIAPPSQRLPSSPESKSATGTRLPEVRPPAKSVDLTAEEKEEKKDGEAKDKEAKKPVDAMAASPKPPPVKP